MSATLFVSAEAVWMPTGWVFEGILERISRQLDECEAPFVVELLEAERDSESDFLDLERADASQLTAFIHAAEAAFNIAFLEGFEPIGSAGDFVWLMWAFSDLIGLLRTDSRLPKKGETGTLSISEKSSWVAPWWAFDLILEHLAAQARVENSSLASSLLVARTTEGRGSCDLSSLDSVHFALIRDTVERLRVQYDDDEGGNLHSPHFSRTLSDVLVELSGKIDEDKRVRMKCDPRIE
jgi:hypothetical protein